MLEKCICDERAYVRHPRRTRNSRSLPTLANRNDRSLKSRASRLRTRARSCRAHEQAKVGDSSSRDR